MKLLQLSTHHNVPDSFEPAAHEINAYRRDSIIDDVWNATLSINRFKYKQLRMTLSVGPRFASATEPEVVRPILVTTLTPLRHPMRTRSFSRRPIQSQWFHTHLMFWQFQYLDSLSILSQRGLSVKMKSYEKSCNSYINNGQKSCTWLNDQIFDTYMTTKIGIHQDLVWNH